MKSMKTVEWAMDNFKVIRFYGDPPYWQAEMSTVGQGLR
jgi:hypothetical protein